MPAFSLEEPAALRAPWLGAPRSCPRFDGRRVRQHPRLPAGRRRGPNAPWGSGSAPSTARGSTSSPWSRARSRSAGGTRSACRPSMRTCRWTARRAWRSAPTGSARSDAAPPSRSIPTPGAAGRFKAPSLDNQVNIRSTGILGRRIHVNVDFDTEREFTSNNDIQVYYEGLEDEIVRRVDVGTVTFQPPSSRFITAAVPANNFGVNAIFDVGPIELQTLAATQKGSVVAERTYTDRPDHEPGPGPAGAGPRLRERALLLGGGSRQRARLRPPSTSSSSIPRPSPPAYRPTEVRVYRYRASRGNSGVNPNLGGITALAPAARRHPVTSARCAGSC